jgi:fluoroquinolone transport system ATP-binding protein
MLEVRDLTYTYPGTQAPAISGLSFSVEPGQIFGFLGPSGAGKSTTQKILIKLLTGYQGRARVFGRDLAEWGADYFERVGVAFELPNHFQRLTARRNLEYFAALYSRPTRPAAELLELLGLADDAGTPVERFSKGMQTRLGVARALLHRPDLLFLDEPTSGLDPLSARRVKDLIRAQRDEGRAVLLTTHNMALADELCDRVALIVDGRIARVDSPRALRLSFGAPRVRVEYLNGAVRSAEFPLAGLAENAEFQRVLRDTAVQTIHSREATLEDVFIAVTGRRLS